MPPWPWLGHALWESARFSHEDTVHAVWLSAAKRTEAAPFNAGNNLLNGNDINASLTCDAASLYGNGFFVRSDAMAVEGCCWNFDGQAWTTTFP